MLFLLAFKHQIAGFYLLLHTVFCIWAGTPAIQYRLSNGLKVVQVVQKHLTPKRLSIAYRIPEAEENDNSRSVASNKLRMKSCATPSLYNLSLYHIATPQN